ncbi:MAG: Jag N-terminal domain-containing protein [Candidatus Aminicenantes bacterium]|nr:Jag N-terminal domain-containing protein [Candidatus Aminicenantes bacterium]
MENEEKTETKPEERQEFKGRNLEDVISLAEHVLKIPREQFNYEIVTEKTKLFGIKRKEIVIRAWPKKESEENAAADFLARLMPVFPLDLTYELKRRNDIIYVIFSGEDKNLLLWNEGELLLSLQHVLNKVSPIKVQVDCEFFRKRKEKKLREFGFQVAQEVRQSGKEEVLDFMNPYERRLIHIAVNQVPGITSESIGDGFLKKIRVFPLPR